MKLPLMNFNLRNFPISILILLLAAPLPAQQASAADPSPIDPKGIVRRSVEIDDRTVSLARDYTYQQREVRKHLGSHGELKFTKVETWDITNLYGEPYSRLIQKDDKPLSAKDEKEEEEKLDKFFSKRREESEEGRQKRQAKEKKEREEEWGFIREVVNAYDFRIVGEEAVDGRDGWVIEATPRKDFRPTKPNAGMLSKIKGKIWIDKQDYSWVKVEGEAIDTISVGLFIARIHKGSHFSFEQVRLNNEVWLMRRLHVDVNARLLLLGNRAVELEETFSNYKKFATNTKILPEVREVEPK
ncbi:MAG TPA: hypothetical protein VFF64_10295 [Candidatus Eremiobacteraceae bacterium]|nr:hypothetical protein [Candidatus Eremiobacteraceae bacterium]